MNNNSSANTSVATHDNQPPIEVPVAAVVEEPIKRVQVPPNMRPGDSFIVTEYGVPFTVVVPEGAPPGTYLNVLLPSEATIVGGDGGSVSGEGDRRKVKIDKGVAGAAIIGAAVGAIVLGPIAAVVLAGGAAVVASQKNSKMGTQVRNVGKETFQGIEKATKWIEKKIAFR